MRTAIAFTFLAALAFARSVMADDWFTPTRVEVRQELLLRRDHSTVTMVTARNGDVQIHVAGSQEGKALSGDMFVIGGRILLAKGIELVPGAEIDAVDVPVLQVQLALKLLARAVPSGPAGVDGSQQIDVSEEKEPVEVGTSSASGAFAPPWSLRGPVRRETPNRVSFKFTFNFRGAPQPVTLSGFWERKIPAPSFPDSLSVAGFRAFTLGPYSRQDAHGTVFDYGAQEMHQGFKTLGDIRAASKKRGGS